jgi:RNase P/RNase MRP subunit p29
MEELACADVKVRLAHTLARLAAGDEGHVVWETHETLAWLIGASREKVTKEVCCLRRQGLVTYPSHHHGIRIVDLDYLRSM